MSWFGGRISPPPKIAMLTKMLKIDSYICSNFFMSKTKILDLFYFSYIHIYKKNTLKFSIFGSILANLPPFFKIWKFKVAKKFKNDLFICFSKHMVKWAKLNFRIPHNYIICIFFLQFLGSFLGYLDHILQKLEI